MRINVEEYHVVLSEEEVYSIVFAIRTKLKSSAQHCANHNGFETLIYNYEEEMKMMEQFCARLGRQDLYEQEIKAIKEEIDELMRSKEENNANVSD